MKHWHRLLGIAAMIACVSLATQSVPRQSTAQPLFGPFGPESVPVRIDGQRADALAVDHFSIDASRIPADPFYRERGPMIRRMPDHELVPEAIFLRLKADALHNPFAPFNPDALPYFDFRSSRLTPSLTTKFGGLTDLDFAEPPDMAVAVSPNWVVQGVNTHWSVFSRTGVKQSGWPKSFVKFFNVPSPGACDPVPFMSDPRAFYIIPDQRFVIAALQVDGPIIGTNCAPLSKYWIAVSKTNNPSGGWNVYAFDMRAGTTNMADFTQLGYDMNGIYFSGNMFNKTGTAYVYAEIFGASKAAMESGSSVTAHGFKNLSAGGSLVDTVQPVESLTQPPNILSQPVEYFINSKNILNCASTCNGVTVWAFANVLGTPKLTAVSVATKTYSLPPFADQTGGGSINTDDQRISGQPIYSGGMINFALSTAVKNGGVNVSGVLWGQVKPVLSGTSITGASIFQSGILSFAGNRSAYFPATMSDSRGNLYMVFDSSSSTMNASTYYAARKPTDALGTLESPVVLFAGQAFYTGGRWGDYEAASLDAFTSTGDIWFASQYTASSGDWKTEIGETRF